MKKNNKGFTLIELLAVVVILLAISVMAISSISAAIERNKQSQDATKKELLVSYARLYYEEHKNSLGTANTGKIMISSLDLTDDEKTDPYGDIYDGCVTYKLSTDEWKYSKTC